MARYGKSALSPASKAKGASKNKNKNKSRNIANNRVKAIQKTTVKVVLPEHERRNMFM
ncbi:hypothetical protein [Paenibacillus macerans]|uniref:hypothetical protein n=1 Tax=Paenibacillus macerans TaxID=44252 RepID=UPI00203F0623|nr:hypothetical protein [Paenibacillus macerans]MCM3702309.1 hypothetical protein [Paenibacillus macerans]